MAKVSFWMLWVEIISELFALQKEPNVSHFWWGLDTPPSTFSFCFYLGDKLRPQICQNQNSHPPPPPVSDVWFCSFVCLEQEYFHYSFSTSEHFSLSVIAASNKVQGRKRNIETNLKHIELLFHCMVCSGPSSAENHFHGEKNIPTLPQISVEFN